MQGLQRFARWEYLVDVQATKDAYADFEIGSAACCACSYCVKWMTHRDTAVPKEIQDWFTSVGIDLTKEAEVTEYEGTNLYLGEYLFVGQVLSGPDPYVLSADGQGALLEPVEIYPGFKLGLSSSNKFGPPIPNSFKGLPLVKVMFMVRTPSDD